MLAGKVEKNRPVGHAHGLGGWYRIFAIVDLLNVTGSSGRCNSYGVSREKKNRETIFKRHFSKVLHEIILTRYISVIYTSYKIIYIYDATHEDKKYKKI